MNRREIRESVYRETGLEPSDTLVTGDVVNRLINRALHRIELEHDWPWLQKTETISTVASTATVTPASTDSDWMRTTSLTETGSGEALEWISIGDYDSRDPAVLGRPYQYCDRDGSLYLWPVPDAVYSLKHRYIRIEPGLTSDDSTPLAPSNLHELIVAYTSYLVLRRARDEDRAQQAREGFGELLSAAKDNRRRHSAPMRPRIRPGAFL